MPITIPDDPAITARARAEGFPDPASYVRYVVERTLTNCEQNDHTGDQSPPVASAAAVESAYEEDLTPQERWERLRTFLHAQEPLNIHDVDDSREAIYPVR